MFTVTLESCFKASHGLGYVGGFVEPVHSHDWIVRVAVEAEELDANGFAVDFIDLKEKVDMTTADLDNNELEKLNCFKGVNASAENVAKYIFDRLIPQLSLPARLVYVEVMEADGCWAKYSN